VIWSGNGYHIYIPINAIVLEDKAEFSSIYQQQPSTQFIRFAEWYLSDGKSDSAHNTTVSLNNCMLRIPNTINSKYDMRSQVSIISKFDNKVPLPKINLLAGSFIAYQKEIQRQEARDNNCRRQAAGNYNCNNVESYYWIEKLLQTPLADYRKNCIWRMLAPYLINVRKLSYDQSFAIISNWLDKCSKLERLGFNARPKIRADLQSAIKKGYKPISLTKLKSDLTYKELYNFLQKNRVI
jgi:hypothetical protein